MQMEGIVATGSGGPDGITMRDTSGNMKAILPSSLAERGNASRSGYILSSIVDCIPSTVYFDHIIIVIVTQDSGGGSSAAWSRGMQHHHPHSR